MLTPLRRLVLSGLLVLALQPAAPVWAACDCGESPEVCCLAGTVQVAPEALALATVSLADIAAVLPDAHSWWAYRPEYNLGLAERLPGELYYVAQRYRQIDTQGELVSTLVLYGDEHQASDAFAAALAAERGEPAEGPAVAEERGYRQAEGYPNVLTTLRFRAGRVMGRLTSTGD
ncbi:MAG: hypothetical protein HUU35_12165, partial [Armatimonadetes bacterium]|nr:hypothetical protein [Armatimonadota bacterium]